jgi:hypothetical protein
MNAHPAPAMPGAWPTRPADLLSRGQGMRTKVSFLIAALVLASLLSACAAGWPPPPTAPECVFIPRCRNPARTTPDGN